jgi:hypothetical protein
MATWPLLLNNGQQVPCPGCHKPLLLSPWGPTCPEIAMDRVKPLDLVKVLYAYHQVLYGLHQNPRKCGSEDRYLSCNALN